MHLHPGPAFPAPRNIASTPGVTEGELIASHCGVLGTAGSALQTRRLRGQWAAVVATLDTLGEVLALTRNDSCTHEQVGRHAGPSAGRDFYRTIDLRASFNHWAHGFAVEERRADTPIQRSLQFFDPHGHAVYQVFLRPASRVAAYFDLVERFSVAQPRPGIRPLPALPPAPETPDAHVDVAGWRDAWRSMRSTQAFARLFQRFGLTRTQGLRLADPAYAQPVPAASAHEVLTRAAQAGVSVQIAVGNPGAIQIHSGPIRRVEVMGPWLSVRDDGFALHLREDHIAQTWLVKHPTSEGLVHALELFDAQGRGIARLDGPRQPGQTESCDWRTLLASMSGEVPACSA